MPETIGSLLEQRAELSGIEFDIISDRQTSLIQRPTRHPVEDGSEMSDFTIQDPPQITLRAEVGNVSLQEDLEATEKARRAYSDLKKFRDYRTLFSYQTGFDIFTDMIISSFVVTEEIGKSGGLIADLTLDQITVTEAEQAQIPPDSVAAGKNRQQLSSEVNAGRVETVPAEEIAI